jgi:hypothetical protein
LKRRDARRGGGGTSYVGDGAPAVVLTFRLNRPDLRELLPREDPRMLNDP